MGGKSIITRRSEWVCILPWFENLATAGLTSAQDIYDSTKLMDIEKKLLLTLNSMPREPKLSFDIPVLFVTDGTGQTRRDEFKFRYETMRKCVDAARYHDGTRLKMREFSLSPDNIRHMLPKQTSLALCNEAIGDFVDAGKIRRC